MAGKGNGGGGSAKATAGRSQGGGSSARPSSSFRGNAVIERKSKPISGGPSSHSQTSANGTGKRSSMTHRMATIAKAAGEGMAETATGATSGIGKFAQRANLENAYKRAVGTGGLAGTVRRFSEEANAAASRGDISRNEYSKVANSRPKEGPTLTREKKTKVKKTGY